MWWSNGRPAVGRVRVEQPALAAGGHRHADGRGQALAERAGGDLHAVGVTVLGVAGGQGAPGAQRLEVVEFQPVPGEVQLDVQGQAGVPAGQHEAIAAGPLRIRGVVPHDPLEQGVRQGGQAHCGAGVPVADLLHGVCGQDPDGVDGSGVEIGPVVRNVGPGEFGKLVGSGHRSGDPPGPGLSGRSWCRQPLCCSTPICHTAGWSMPHRGCRAYRREVHGVRATGVRAVSRGRKGTGLRRHLG